mgnify:CR=1 FL=1
MFSQTIIQTKEYKDFTESGNSKLLAEIIEYNITNLCYNPLYLHYQQNNNNNNNNNNNQKNSNDAVVPNMPNKRQRT